MSKIATKIRTKTETKVQRPRLHKVLLFNDDYTPRDFVVEVLKAVFRLNEIAGPQRHADRAQERGVRGRRFRPGHR